MSEAIVPHKLPDEMQAKLSGLNLNLCLTCGTCAGGCPITGSPEAEGLDVRKVFRMLAFGMLDEVVASKFPWLCTGCGRCAAACPMDLDTPAIMGYMKHLRPRDKVPGVLAKGVEQVIKSGNTDAAEMLRAMRSFLKENDMMAYLAMMAIRLLELHRVLERLL